jgi:hypothetical protein
MKNTLVVLAFLCVAVSAFAQKSSKTTEWKEKETFHAVMAKTFHPMEDGNFAPIKARAAEMSDKAKKWADAKPPKQFNKPEIKELLSKLTTESKALAELVAAKGSDDDIKKSLTALHERFHEVSGACKVDAKTGKHEHKD